MAAQINWHGMERLLRRCHAMYDVKCPEWLLLRRCNLSNIGDRVYVRVTVIFSITWPRPDQVATDLVTSVSARYSKSIITKVRYSLSPPSQRRLELGLVLMLGLLLGLFSALLGPARTRPPMFDRLLRRNNSHGLKCHGFRPPARRSSGPDNRHHNVRHARLRADVL